MTSGDGYHELYEASPAAILTVDRAGHIVDCNRAACIRLARARGELLGGPVLRWISPLDRARSKTYFLQAFRGGVVEWKARFRRGDGFSPVMELRACAFGGSEAGAPKQLHVFLSELAESRFPYRAAGHLQTALEIFPDQFVLLLDGDGCIRYSAGLERTLWYGEEECMGRDSSFLFANGPTGRDLLSVLRRETAAGRRWEGEPWLVRKDGSRFPARMVAVPYSDPRDDRPIGTLLVGRDVSDEHAAADRLAKAERLAHIGEVVASIAYELETPARRIAELVAETRKHDGSTGDDAPAADLERESEKVARLAHSLYAFALDTRAESTHADTLALIDEAITDEAALCEETGVRIERALPADLPETFVAPDHFRTLLRHLLENAREAAQHARHGQVRVRGEATPSAIEIHISDNGPGVREEWRERIFEPFFTTKNGRLGLGLAIARGIVAAYGGRIWADHDEHTGGAKISVALPVEPPSYTAAFRPHSLAVRRPRSILVVDDDEGLRKAICTFLEKLGYSVTEAWSGRSALARITSGVYPELVITDLKMKDGTGYWFLRELARDFPRILRRTVILTGDPSHAAVDRIQRETDCPVIRKPFDFQVLLDRLYEVASRD